MRYGKDVHWIQGKRKVLTPGQKSVAASVVLVLAILQLVAISLGRGWVGGARPRTRSYALLWHRTGGFITFTLMVAVAYYCLKLISVTLGGPRVIVHMVLGSAVLALVIAKIAIVERLHRHYAKLPFLGAVLFVTVIALWISGAGWYFVIQKTGY